ncbi:shikimate dehydrogenase [Egibacter rhizosphaerae]|uniref:Shikimate dehydrogenase (NADP(+)) n=1 Tax=Egibacter rhizosphaerae TaxID=1670831 RepID=A0A411YJZ6_9ACTN|nr:shikimate dehydrogenase [Egibacter rhizosphaerae]QBI21500.1 shikimate dehydrogenase [Egibacter rhizosphaerae]
MTTAATWLVALLGQPVGHSGSPAIHTAAFAAAGVDAAYLAFEVAPERLATAVSGLRALGALGANVTVPHKTAALALADAATEEAQLVGAANTLFWRTGSTGEAVLTADNTDAAGLERELRDDLGLVAGDTVVLFGSGGAARAAAVALGRVGARVEVSARRAEAAGEIAELAARAGAVPDEVGEPRCVINATPLGLAGESLPARFMTLGDGQIALDLVYGVSETPFLRAGAAGGATVRDGTGMLIEQAALAFERWIGSAPPRSAMRAALAT